MAGQGRPWPTMANFNIDLKDLNITLQHPRPKLPHATFNQQKQQALLGSPLGKFTESAGKLSESAGELSESANLVKNRARTGSGIDAKT